jgi:GNAT superfamily N-acetyltransferase
LTPNPAASPSIRIRNDLRPGDLGQIVKLHGKLYAAEYGLDHTFEPYVAAPMAAFVLRADARERIWIVESGADVAGALAIVAASPTEAQLRWFLLAPKIRGRGLGRRLVAEAVAFARSSGYHEIFLWTLGGLEAALHIYRSLGFRRTETKPHRLWGQDLVEEKYVLRLKEAATRSPAAV